MKHSEDCTVRGIPRLRHESSAELPVGSSSDEQCILAEALKQEGNNELREGRLRPALDRYTRGLVVMNLSSAADQHTQNKLRATLLSNRSASLHKLGRFHEAIADAEMASLAWPSWAKPFYRKAQACLGLHLNMEAIECLQDFLRSAADGDADNADIKQLLRVAQLANAES